MCRAEITRLTVYLGRYANRMTAVLMNVGWQQTSEGWVRQVWKKEDSICRISSIPGRL